MLSVILAADMNGMAPLHAGADDYLIKPFAFEELLARVRTLVRRRYDQQNPVLQIADLVIDTAAQTVRRGERLIELTAREYSLLEYLAPIQEDWRLFGVWASSSNSRAMPRCCR